MVKNILQGPNSGWYIIGKSANALAPHNNADHIWNDRGAK